MSGLYFTPWKQGRCLFKQRGFTIVELIVVIVLLGILSAVAIPRFANVTSFQSASLRHTVLGSLKLAQKTALAQHASSVYWVLEQEAIAEWRVRIMIDTDLNDSGNLPEEITPAQLQDTILVSYTVSYSSAITGSVGDGGNLVVMYDQLGDVIRIKEDVDLTDPTEFPDSSDAVTASLQFTDDRGAYCLSLTGYAYAAACR